MSNELVHNDTNTTERVDFVTPQVEIYEDDQALWVSADLPGVGPEHLEVSFDDGYLTVSGQTNGGPQQAPKVARAYRRRFALTDPSRFDTDHISAVLRHGVLELRLPKAEKAKRRQIPVTVN